MIPEREREALMRLTMCAREECGMCKYKDTCDFDFQYETATRCMNILADALRTADRKTELQTTDYCDICNHKGCDNCVADGSNPYCVPSQFEPKDEPQTETKTETQNSNLTFEKRTMRDCYNCKRYETEGECIECHYEPKDEPQTVLEAVLDRQTDEDRRKMEESVRKAIKDEPQTDCSWGEPND